MCWSWLMPVMLSWADLVFFLRIRALFSLSFLLALFLSRFLSISDLTLVTTDLFPQASFLTDYNCN